MMKRNFISISPHRRAFPKKRKFADGGVAATEPDPELEPEAPAEPMHLKTSRQVTIPTPKSERPDLDILAKQGLSPAKAPGLPPRIIVEHVLPGQPGPQWHGGRSDADTGSEKLVPVERASEDTLPVEPWRDKQRKSVLGEMMDTSADRVQAAHDKARAKAGRKEGLPFSQQITSRTVLIPNAKNRYADGGFVGERPKRQANSPDAPALIDWRKVVANNLASSGAASNPVSALGYVGGAALGSYLANRNIKRQREIGKLASLPTSYDADKGAITQGALSSGIANYGGSVPHDDAGEYAEGGRVSPQSSFGRRRAPQTRMQGPPQGGMMGPMQGPPPQGPPPGGMGPMQGGPPPGPSQLQPMRVPPGGLPGGSSLGAMQGGPPPGPPPGGMGPMQGPPQGGMMGAMQGPPPQASMGPAQAPPGGPPQGGMGSMQGPMQGPPPGPSQLQPMRVPPGGLPGGSSVMDPNARPAGFASGGAVALEDKEGQSPRVKKMDRARQWGDVGKPAEDLPEVVEAHAKGGKIKKRAPFGSGKKKDIKRIPPMVTDEDMGPPPVPPAGPPPVPVAAPAGPPPPPIGMAAGGVAKLRRGYPNTNKKPAKKMAKGGEVRGCGAATKGKGFSGVY